MADPSDELVLSIWQREEAVNAYAASGLRVAVEAAGVLNRTNFYVLRAAM